MSDVIMMARSCVDNQSVSEELMDSDVTSTMNNDSDVLPSIVESIGVWNGKVVVESMDHILIGQNGDVNRSRVPDILENTAPDGVSQITSNIKNNDNVQLVKPLAPQAFKTVERNFADRSEYEVCWAIAKKYASEQSEVHEDHVASDLDSNASEIEDELDRILRTVSKHWAFDATGEELREFAKHEAVYADPYTGRSYIIDDVLLRRDRDAHTWRGQPVERLDPVELARFRMDNDDDYLVEVMNCECGAEFDVDGAEFRADVDLQWFVEHGSPVDVLCRLNKHERHLEGEMRISDEMSVTPEEIRVKSTLGCTSTPISDQVSNETHVTPETEISDLVNKSTLGSALAIKRWLQQMRAADAEFGDKCAESARILRKLEDWRVEKTARRTLREMSEESEGEDSVEIKPERRMTNAFDRIGDYQPPRWHGRMTWRDFWNAFCRWCRGNRMTDYAKAQHLREAIAGPVENKLIETLGSGRWTYAHVVGALQDRCRRLLIGRSNATAGDFALGPVQADQTFENGRTQWKQYTQKLFDWSDEQKLGLHEQNYVMWRQFVKPTGDDHVPMLATESVAHVTAFSAVRLMSVDAESQGLVFREERQSTMHRYLPVYDGEAKTWQEFLKEFTEWCDERQCDDNARAQYLRRSLIGHAANEIMTEVGVDALVYQQLVEKLERLSADVETTGSERVRESTDKASSVRMPIFYGRGWSKFIQQFEAVCDLHRLREEAKAHYLRRAIVGPVAADVGTILGVDWYTYERLRFELTIRYDSSVSYVSGDSNESSPMTTAPRPVTPQIGDRKNEYDDDGNFVVYIMKDKANPVMPQTPRKRLAMIDEKRPRRVVTKRTSEQETINCMRRYLNSSMSAVHIRMADVQRQSDSLAKKLAKLQRDTHPCTCKDGEHKAKKKTIAKTQRRYGRKKQASTEDVTAAPAVL